MAFDLPEVPPAERGAIPVKEVMTAELVTIERGKSVVEAAKLMKERGIGSVLVVNESGDVVGIITERDIALRVVAEGLDPKEVRVEDIMSTPVISIDEEETLLEAAKRMSRLGIRRLLVRGRDGKPVGIVSSRDILAVTPSLIAVLVEKLQIASSPMERREEFYEGYCDICGEWSNELRPVEGKFVCPDCYVDVISRKEEYFPGEE